MSNFLVINITGKETRVALIEKNVLAELLVERQSERGLVGNIYKGRVVRVLPGMQAAFVDIGTDKAAFLYATDVLQDHIPYFLEEEEPYPDDGTPIDDMERLNAEASPRKRRPTQKKIEELLYEGKEILVQVAKDPIGTKGARITCHISLPGRHLVFMPTVNHIGISRRILEETERRRLKDLIEEMRPEGSGFIARTAAEAESTEHLRRDMKILIQLWQEILRKRDEVRAPSLIHEDFDLILRATRDLVTTNISKIVVDNLNCFYRIPDFVQRYMPGFPCTIELYKGQVPIFDAYGIEIEIQRALQRKVWLKSGAYLVIDQTEALTAIDINTGRYVGKTDLEDTITRINLEAVDEIAYQLRLRNIGGLIIIDFIDMDSATNRERVYQALAKALEEDKTRTNVLKISDFGLVEMTRKRVKDNLLHQLCEPCPYCHGRGHVKSANTVGYEMLRQLEWKAKIAPDRRITVAVNRDVKAVLDQHERLAVDLLEKHYHVRVQVRAQEALHREDFQITKGEGE